MLKKINQYLYFLEGTNGGRIPYANSLLIVDEVTAIVDTGADLADLELVAAQYKPDIVINTHFHIDHSGGNVLFPEAKIMAHPWDANILTCSKKFLEATGLAVLGEEYIRANFFGEQLPLSQIKDFLQDGDVLDFGVTKFKVIHTPGHTPGHCALFHEEDGILFAGDIDLTSFGPWYGNPASDLDDFEESIKKLRDLKPRLVLTGHLGPLTEGITERFERYLGVIEERDHLVLKFLQEPKQMDEIIDAKLIYRKHPEPVAVYRRFEELLVGKHLDRLEKNGFVIKTEDYYMIA